MKHIFPAILLSPMLLVGCGAETDRSDSSAPAQSAAEHFFGQPYECTRESEVTSKRTGKTSIVKHYSYYLPEKGWRIDLSDMDVLLVANLYTPATRYDGSFKKKGDEIVDIKFATAWPLKADDPDRALNNLSKMEKQNCKLMDDTAIFDINYLDTLEVMGK